MAVPSLSTILSGEWPTLQVLDIGAAPEGGVRYQPLLDHGLAEVTGFEPQPEQLAKLRQMPGRHRWLPYVLGDGSVGTFHVTRFPGCSSLLEPDPAIIDPFHRISATRPGGNFHVIDRQSVKTVRLDDVPDRPRPDHIKIDVQGASLLVLRNGTETMRGALVVEAETEFVPLYKGQATFGELQVFMQEQGFLFHKFLDICGRAFEPMAPANPAAAVSQALWADAIFVRDFTALDRYAPADLQKAALLLHDVYASYDLALRFLIELDRRQGSDLGTRYLPALLALGTVPRQFMTIKESFYRSSTGQT